MGPWVLALAAAGCGHDNAGEPDAGVPADATTDAGQQTDAVTAVVTCPPTACFAVASPAACDSAEAIWEVENPLPVATDLRAAASLGNGAIAAVGEAGRIVVIRDNEVSVTVFDPEVTLNAIWAAAPDDVWAVGDSGTILHWDGVAWARRDGPYVVQIDFTAVGGSGITDVWLGGQRDTTSFLWRGDGESWHHAEFAQLNGVVRAIAGTAVWDMWVGADAQTAESPGGLWRWSGAAWEGIFGGPIRALWAAGPQDLWAASDSGLYHWDGLTCEVRAGAATEFLAVAGLAPDEVYASTTGGTGFGRWDGESWQFLPPPRTRAGASQDSFTGIRSLIADSTGLWAVGDGGMLAHRSANEWTTLGCSVTDASIGSAWGSTAALWASNGEGLAQRDGCTWRKAIAPPSDITSVSGSATGDVWALTVAGTVFRFDGESWSPVVVPTEVHHGRIWAVAADDVWIAGDTGGGFAALHFDGNTWSCDACPDEITGVIDVWASGADDVWILGEVANGDAPAPTGRWHWDGASWTSHAEPDASWVGVWGASRNQVYFAGFSPDDTGLIQRWTGSAMAHEPVPDLARPDLIAGAGDRAFVWSNQGRTLAYRTADGWVTEPVTLAPTHDIRTMWATAPGELFLFGETGLIVRRYCPAEN